MFQDIKNIKNQKLRYDTPFRIGAGFVVLVGFTFFSVSALNFSLFIVAYFWTQAWSYGGHYLERKFRPAFMRIVMEMYFPLARQAQKHTGLKSFFYRLCCYLQPAIFCLFIVYLSSHGNLLFAALGCVLGAVINYLFSGYSLDMTDVHKTDQDFGSAKVLSEVEGLEQNHQTDSEKDL